MNKYVVVAVISLGITIFSRIITGVLALLYGTASVLSVVISLVVAAVIFVGFIERFRLAWQWGRILGLLGAILLTFTGVALLVRVRDDPGVLLAGVLIATQGVPLFPMFFALGTRDARAYFRVICPKCGSSEVKGGNFLFTKAQCKQCNLIWD